jgi:SagB-type dehydrogenase family enzyme
MTNHLGLGRPAWQKIGEPSAGIEVMGYPEALLRRRSKRNFIKKRVTKPCMDAFLKALCAKDHPGGTDRSSYEECLSVGFLAANVEGMDPGFYLVDPAKSFVGKVKPGAFTETMTSICLDQAWLAYAGVHFLFMANLDILDRVHGPRGYRYAMMVAGRLGQRLYVAATALGLGCCGIGALYDGEAAELLGLDDSSRLLYLVAAGTVKKA